MNLFSFDYCQLLRLHLERGDGMALLEMLGDRVAHHSRSAWTADVRRRRSDMLLHSHQHITVLDALLRDIELHGQRPPLSDLDRPRPSCHLVVEKLQVEIDINHLPGIMRPAASLLLLGICHLFNNIYFNLISLILLKNLLMSRKFRSAL